MYGLENILGNSVGVKLNGITCYVLKTSMCCGALAKGLVVKSGFA